MFSRNHHLRIRLIASTSDNIRIIYLFTKTCVLHYFLFGWFIFDMHTSLRIKFFFFSFDMRINESVKIYTT